MKNDREFHTYRGYQKLRQEDIQLTPSMEDYLEMICRMCQKKEIGRASCRERV